MKTLIICVFLIQMLLQQQFTVTEYNMLYHQKNLGTGQFDYVGEEALTHTQRFENTINTFNSIMADIMLVVEWNGNNLSPYYIDRQDILIEQLKKELEKAEIHIDFSRIMPSLEYFMAAVKGSSIEQELIDRYITILNVNNLEFIRNPNYVWDFTLKSSGVVVRNGKVQLSSLLPPPVMTNKNFMAQAMFFAYNSEVFEEFKKKEVFAMVADENSPIDSQNFMVRYLRHLQSKKEFIVINAHFKSKHEGFPKRDRHAKEIAHYIKTLQVAYPEANFILMGNLNAEIQEIAFDFNYSFVRLEDQKRSDNKFNPKIIFTPFSVLPDLDERIFTLEEKLYAMEKFYKNRPTTIDEENKIDDTKQEISKEIEYLQAQKKIALNANSQSFDYWVEANNFPTARKIRVQEINFSNGEYERFLRQTIPTRPENFSGFPDCTHFLVGNNRFTLPRTDENKEILDYEFAIKEDRFHHRKVFSETIDCLKNVLKQIQQHPNLQKEANIMEESIRKFLDSLMVEEKTDFIFLRFVSDFKIVAVETVPNYPEQLKTGIPNYSFASDHFPIRVTIEVSDSNKFNNFVFKNLPTANGAYKERVFQAPNDQPMHLVLKI